jgi:hypothetical protein
MSTELSLAKVIEGIKTLVDEAKNAMELEGDVDEETQPGLLIKSQVLVTIIGRLEDLLQVKIPINCYPFFDKDLNKQLSIKEAAQILLKKIEHGR